MRFAKYKMSSLNEALLGNCNIEDSDEIGITTAVDPTYAKAINDRKVRKEKAEDAFKDSEKLHKDFVADNHKREVKTETTKEMKAMKLAEDVKVESPAIDEEEIEVKSTDTSTEPLTEAADFGNPTEMGRGACTPLAPNFSKDIQQYVEHLGEDPREDKFIKKSLNRFAESLFHSMEEVEAFNDYWTARYPAMIDYINSQLALIPEGILDNHMMKPVHEEVSEDENFIDYYDIEDHPDIDKEYTATYVYTNGEVSNSAWNWADFMTYTTQEFDKHGIEDPDVVSITVADDETGEILRRYTNKNITSHPSIVHEDINEDDDIEGLDEFLDVSVPVTANVTANGNSVPFMNGVTGLGEDIEDPHFFAVDEDTLNEAPVATAEPKTRTRGENEVKYQRDYSSEDLWLAVYDELSSEVDNEGSGQQVDKQIKAKRGERYENVYPHGDSDIIIYATNPEEFEFAKKVAQHYGVTCREPREDTNPATNNHYKWSMVIEIPEDELFDSAFKPLHKDDEF